MNCSDTLFFSSEGKAAPPRALPPRSHTTLGASGVLSRIESRLEWNPEPNSINSIIHVFNISCYFALFRLISLYLLFISSIKLDSFPFHKSFCHVFDTFGCVEAIALRTWKACGMQEHATASLFHTSLRPFLKLTTFCCPCGFLWFPHFASVWLVPLHGQ